MLATEAPFIAAPLRDVDAWAACFDPAALPVLAETALTLEELRAHEDDVHPRLLAETVTADPLLTLKLLAHVGMLRRQRDADGCSAPETVTAALVMLGISPFFRDFGSQTAVEDVLADQPQALAGFRAVLRRSHRASTFATAFAVHRMDHDVAVIHEAALLHDFAELLLWLRAPALALPMAERQCADPALRTSRLQRETLNIELSDLQHQLMLAWRLPALLVQISHDRHAEGAQARNVTLANRLARHSAHGWDNPALPDDVRSVADLLQLGIEPTWKLLQSIDA